MSYCICTLQFVTAAFYNITKIKIKILGDVYSLDDFMV